MESIYAHKALLPTGWASEVRLVVREGRITDLVRGASLAIDDRVADCVLPGMPNAHSHAFQRALAGRTEQRSPAGRDSFWTWRERMYRLAAIIDPERLAIVARQAYTEMLVAGYTSVAEFHYLHRTDDGEIDLRMFAALTEAAREAGIRLTYVPVLYERGGFEQSEPEPEQRHFASTAGTFLRHVEQVRRSLDEHERLITVGVGAHSIRAVAPESLAEIARFANADGCPMHIHIAEQQREVDQSLAFNQRRPVRWLLENADVGSNWCLVHATHMDHDEIEQVAASKAVVCLCPSTEANLGDGLFPLRDYLERSGRIAIGSDSHVSLNPFEELRWLEYGQRLATQSRNIASIRDGHVGRELYERALEGGARALGQAKAGLVEGAVADLVCLYGDDPMLAGHGDASRLDALVFSGYRLPIERVMVDGRWVVEDGDHVRADESRDAFSETMQGIAAEVGSAGR